jgi:hypothetical protein
MWIVRFALQRPYTFVILARPAPAGQKGDEANAPAGGKDAQE